MASIGFNDFEIDPDLLTLARGDERIESGIKPLNTFTH